VAVTEQREQAGAVQPVVSPWRHRAYPGAQWAAVTEQREQAGAIPRVVPPRRRRAVPGSPVTRL